MLSFAKNKAIEHKLFNGTPIFVCLLASLFFASCANHTDINKAKSTFYVIQPAEHYPGFDGHLSWYGRLRAGDLMRLLKDSGIQRMYVTPFARSVETVDSLRALHPIDTVEYIIDSSGASIMKLLKQRSDFGRKVLIVVRPFVIPALIRKLGVQFEKDTISQYGFNRVYIVVNNKGKASVKEQTFGRPPRPVDTGSKR